MKNIIVTGISDTETRGILSMLNDCQINASPYLAEDLGVNDLLIVGLSAEPLIGWGLHLSSLLEKN